MGNSTAFPNATVTVTEQTAGSLGASSSLPGETVEVIDDVVTSCYGVDDPVSGNTTLTCSVTKISSPLFVPIADERGLMISQYVHTCLGSHEVCQHSTGSVVGDRVIEIYNPHCGNAIDMSVYAVHVQQKYGLSWTDALATPDATTKIELTGTMLGKQTYTLCNQNASNVIKSNCDLIVPDNLFNFDGTLPVALVKSGEVCDAVGEASATSCQGTLTASGTCSVSSETEYRSMFINVANSSSYGTLWGHSVSRVGRVISPEPSWIISSGISKATSEWEVEKTVVVTDSFNTISVDRKEEQAMTCQADGGQFLFQMNGANTTLLRANASTNTELVAALNAIGVSTSIAYQDNNLGVASTVPCSSQLNGLSTMINFTGSSNGNQDLLHIYSDDIDPLYCNDRTEDEIQTIRCTGDSGDVLLSSPSTASNTLTLQANATNATYLQTQLLAQLNLTVNATYIPDDSSQTMVTLCGSGVGTAVKGTARITFMAPTTGNIPTITVASTTVDFLQNDGSTPGSIAIAETVRGVVNSNVCATNVAALGASVVNVVEGFYGNVNSLASSTFVSTAVDGVVGKHESQECRYRLNNYEACEYLDDDDSVELQYKKPYCTGKLPEDCSYENQPWSTFEVFNNTRKTMMASTSTVGTFEDLSIDIPVEARSWGTKFRFYQPHYGDDVNAPMNAEFLVNSYVTEVFNLATKDCWSLKDVKFTSDKRTLCATGSCPVVAGVQELTSVIILDDGDSGTLSFYPSNVYNFTEPSSSSDVAITVTRMHGSSKDITFAYEIVASSSTATIASDFKAVGKPILTIADGEDVKVFTITVIADDTYENPNEYFTVRLSDATNGALFVDGVDFLDSRVYIIDDGDCKVSFSNLTYSALENHGVYEVALERIGGLDKGKPKW